MEANGNGNGNDNNGNGYANGTQFLVTGSDSSSIRRSSFPDDFIFGSGSAAYQYEGAAREGGRGASIWDNFTQKWPGRITDGNNGNVAVDFYHQYKEDVKIVKKMGWDSFRFSISWSRILPAGKLNQGINKEGIQFYNDLIDELLANGITPFVTIFHWDVPQALDDEYGGFLSPKIVPDFCDFAGLCFWEFGDRVKHWTTLNEPWSFSNCGYCIGTNAPGRGTTAPAPVVSPANGVWSFQPLHRGSVNISTEPFDNGNPATEPYLVAHNLLLSHAAVVDLYRKNYQDAQKGVIGITNVTSWMVPYSDSLADVEAAKRALDFQFGWFMDPVVNGHYPHSMRKYVGNRLPEFTEIESEKLRGSYDFIGVNYYTAQYVADASNVNVEKLSYTIDPQVQYTSVRNDVPIGPQAGCGWIYLYPKGIYDLTMYVKKKYKNPLMYITENGWGDESQIKARYTEARMDEMRKTCYIDHLRYLLEAIEDGVKLKGYFAWALLDNFEWSAGYSNRFGMVYIDYRDGCLTRYPKESAIWFMNFLKGIDIESLNTKTNAIQKTKR